MKKFLLIGFVLLGLASGCGDSQGGGLDFDPDGGGIVGSGVDPGKSASTCYPAFANNELNVVTWNIEFLSSGNTDLNKVKSIVESLDADIIAVQEINSISSFNDLANSLSEWQGYSIDIGGSLDLGFLVKTDAFLEIGNIYVAVDTSPRETIGINVKHASGIEVTLLNVHLKALGGSSNVAQREAAAIAIKSHIDSNLSSEAVIVLGDFNDDITESDTPFENFINDSNNYSFADIGIALGSTANFSYPSWPSHIDHILITDELFNKVGLVQTIKPESCVSNYDDDVSDHRPVLASFK